jgi:FlaA1/EpsC-like NDP-sugar epimerase
MRLGAGGTSRDIADTVADINRVHRRWNLLGFLDDDVTKHRKTVAGLPVLGPIDCAKRYTGRLIMGWRGRVTRGGDERSYRGSLLRRNGSPR